MSTEAHLAELENQHRALDAKIAEARGHPSMDDLQIVELKRRKLQVKDEIARLQYNTSVH
ncbi:MAG: YdcH family protein [Xanthobacteraceae bacterium]